VSLLNANHSKYDLELFRASQDCVSGLTIFGTFLAAKRKKRNHTRHFAPINNGAPIFLIGEPATPQNSQYLMFVEFYWQGIL
jgi:hypothetical protein